MEYLLLLVLVVIWMILRSRDKQHRAAADAALLARAITPITTH